MGTKVETKLWVGATLNDVTRDVLDDVARYERGETVKEDRLIFENWRALFSVLTPKRYELLQHLHNKPEPSVRALARALDRDFKRVHGDVTALLELGLIEKDAEWLRADYQSVSTEVTF